MISRIKVSKGQIKDQIFEDYLGLPPVDGYIISSDTLGNRTWIDPTTVGGSTEISIQDDNGVEQFKITDSIQFEGLNFDSNNNRLIAVPLTTETVYIDVANGDDATAQVLNITKPFKTFSAAQAAIPEDGISWTYYFVGSATTVDLDGGWPQRSFKLKCDQAVTFNTGNMTSPTITPVNVFVEMDVPNGTLRNNSSTNRQTLVISGLRGSMKLNFKTIELLSAGGGYPQFSAAVDSDAGGPPKSYIKCQHLIYNLTTNQYNTFTNIWGEVYIEKFSILNGFSLIMGNNYGRKQELHIDEIVLGMNVAQFFTNHWPAVFSLKKISGDYTFSLGLSSGSDNELKVFDVNGLIIECQTFDLGRRTGETLVVTGAMGDNGAMIDVGLNTLGGVETSSQLVFQNFSGKISRIGSGDKGFYTFRNSNIIIDDYLYYGHNHKAAAIGPTTTFEGSNTLTTLLDPPGCLTDDMRESQSYIYINGPFHTNCTGFGHAVDPIFEANSFKEKKNELIIRDKQDIVNKELDSTINYIIDGDIALDGDEHIVVPEGGLTLTGYSFDASRIGSYGNDYHSIFTSDFSTPLLDKTGNYTIEQTIGRAKYNGISMVDGKTSVYFRGGSSGHGADTKITTMGRFFPDGSRSYSIGVWFYSDGWDNGTDVIFGTMYSPGQGNMGLFINSSGELIADMRQGLTVLATGIGNDKTWHYAELVWDGSTLEGRVNLDGVDIPLTIGTKDLVTFMGDTLTLAKNTYGSGSTFAGYIDRFFVYDRARTTAESVASYNGGLSIPYESESTTNLMAYYNMDDKQRGSGNLVIHNMAFTTTGVGANVFDIQDIDGSHALEMITVNFEGCQKIGLISGYRQGTGITIGFYGCNDGLEFQGVQNGFKLTNTNAFGFGSGGTMFKKYGNLTFNNRFYLEVNVDLPSDAILCDFGPENFNDNQLLQINTTLAKIGGVIDPDTAQTQFFPNITHLDPKALFTDNIGLKNTPNLPVFVFSDDTTATSSGLSAGHFYVDGTSGFVKQVGVGDGSGGGGGSTGVQTLSGNLVDNTDPQNPIVNITDITEIANRSYNNLQDLPTIPDPTSISIQNDSGVEQFVVTDTIQFNGVEFDPANNKISTAPLTAYTVFIDPDNGDDTTGQLQNSKHPYKTIGAAFTATPTDGYEWTYYFIGDFATTTITDDFPTDRTFIIKSDTSGEIIIDNTVSYLDNGYGLSIIMKDGTLTFKGIQRSLGGNEKWTRIEVKTINMLTNSSGQSSTFHCGNVYGNAQESWVICENFICNNTEGGDYGKCVGFKGYVEVRNKLTIQAGWYGFIHNSSPDLYINHIECLYNVSFTSAFPNYMSLKRVSGAGNLNLGQFLNHPMTLDVEGLVIDAGAGNFNFPEDRSSQLTVIGTVLNTNGQYIQIGDNYGPNGYLILANFSGPIKSIDVADSNNTITLLNSNVRVADYFLSGGTHTCDVIVEGMTTIITETDPPPTLGNVTGSAKLIIRGVIQTNAVGFGANVDVVHETASFKEKSKELVVRDKRDIVNRDLDSSISYVIDGDIALDNGEYIYVPVGGLTILGYSFDASRLGSYGVKDHKIFRSKVDLQTLESVTNTFYQHDHLLKEDGIYLDGEMGLTSGSASSTVSHCKSESTVAWSVGCWFKPENAGINHSLICAANRVAGTQCFFLRILTNGQLEFQNHGTKTILGTVTWDDWNYVELKWDGPAGDTDVTGFLNGVTTNCPKGTGYISETLLWGSSSRPWQYGYYQGTMSNMFLYSRKRTTTETSDNYAAGPTETYTDWPSTDLLRFYEANKYDNTPLYATEGSGNLVIHNVAFTTTGDNAGVFDITDSDGSHALEMITVNFEGCSTLGTINNYRQGTGITIGIYGCDDGLTMAGTWNGFKLTNTNAFGFGSSGTLFKAGTGLNFNNRFYLDVNVDLPSGAALCDFDSTNFNDDELFQITNALIKYNSVIDNSNTSVLIPNIGPNDTKSRWINNIGIENTATDYTDYSSPDGSIYRLSVDNDGTLSLGDTTYGDAPPPIQNIDSPYTDLSAMYADQANQTQGYAQRVTGDEKLYYYLGTTTGDITDYLTFDGSGVDDSNYAKLDQTNTFTQQQRFDGGTRIGGAYVADDTGASMLITSQNASPLNYITFRSLPYREFGHQSGVKFTVERNNYGTIFTKEVLNSSINAQNELTTLMDGTVNMLSDLNVAGNLEVDGSFNTGSAKIGQSFAGDFDHLEISRVPLAEHLYFNLHAKPTGSNIRGSGIRLQAERYRYEAYDKKSIIEGFCDRNTGILWSKTEGNFNVEGVFVPESSVDLSNLLTATDDTDAGVQGVSVGHTYINSTTGQVQVRQSSDNKVQIVNTSRELTNADNGKILLITATVTLTYPSGGLNDGFACEVDVDSTGALTIADSAATPGDDLNAPHGTTLAAEGIGTLYRRPDNIKLRLKGEFE